MPVRTIKLKRTNLAWANVSSETLQYGEPFFNKNTGDLLIGNSDNMTVSSGTRYFHSVPKALSDKGVFYNNTAPSSSSSQYLTNEAGAGIFPYTTIENVMGSGGSSLTDALNSKANLASPNFSGTPQIGGVNIITKNYGYVYESVSNISSLDNLKTKLAEWISAMPVSSVRFFYFTVSGAWSPFYTGAGVIVVINRQTTGSSFGGTALLYSKESADGAPRVAILSCNNGTWGDIYKLLRADEDRGGVQSVGITAGAGISVSGSPITDSGNITVGHVNTITAGTYGSTTVVPKITFNDTGHITSVSNQTIALASLSGTLGTAHGGTGNTSVDTIPVSGSTKMVTSGGVYSYLNSSSTSSVTNYKPYYAGTSAPSNKNLLWIDTTATTGGLKYYNGSSWVHVPVAFV